MEFWLMIVHGRTNIFKRVIQNSMHLTVFLREKGLSPLQNFLSTLESNIIKRNCHKCF